MINPTCLILGNGVLARHVLQILAQGNPYAAIVLASRDGETALRTANTTRHNALNRGISLHIRSEEIDLTAVDRTAETLRQIDPDVILNLTSLQSWWVVTELPEPQRTKVAETRFGPWLPMHLSLTAKLMRAVRAAGIRPCVVNASFPDAVNPALTRVGLGPDLGIGNVANVVPGLRFAIADVLGIGASEVEVRLCAHHFVSYRLPGLGHTDGAPFALSVTADGRDVTAEIDLGSIFATLRVGERRLRGIAGQPVTGSSAAAVVCALEAEVPTLVHAPGPLGLPGGYPLHLSRGAISLALPAGVTKDEAITVNEAGQVFDGVKSIEADGTVVFNEREADLMRDLFGYDCRRLAVEDADEAARELSARYRGFVKTIRGAA